MGKVVFPINEERGILNRLFLRLSTELTQLRLGELFAIFAVKMQSFTFIR